jgi:5-methylcytosine-specific restriction endonuclease McrA
MPHRKKKRKSALTKERKAQSLQRAFRFASDRRCTLPLTKARNLVDNPPDCPYCYAPIPWRNISVDHAIPRARGGSSEPTNLVWTDVRCNQLKGTLLPDEFLELQRFMDTNAAVRRDLESRLLAGGGWRYGRRK